MRVPSLPSPFARRRRSMVAAGVVGMCLATGVGLATAVTSPSSSPPTPTAPIVLRDASGQLALSVQLLGGGLRPVGTYELTVTGTGSYSGVIPLSLNGGSGVYHLSGTTSTVLVSGADATRTFLQLRMEGIVQPEENSANVDIWVGTSVPANPAGCASPLSAAADLGSGRQASPAATCSGSVTKYHLRTVAASVSEAAQAAAAVVNAMQMNNSAALWSLLSPEVQQGLGDPSALQPLFASGQGWTLISSSLVSPGATSFNEGYEFYAQAVQGTVQSPARVASTEYSVVLFVFEGGAWKFIGAESPSA